MQIIQSNLSFVKSLIQSIPSKTNAIDATVGNGHDTAFLASCFHHVYGFDIQIEAIEATRSRHLSNVTLIHDGHQHMSKYVKQPVQCILFNLGYLPNHDHSIQTTPPTTLAAISSGLELIDDGLMIIVCYQGHDDQEAIAVETFCQNLDKHNYHVLKYHMINKSKPPFVIVIECHSKKG